VECEAAIVILYEPSRQAGGVRISHWGYTMRKRKSLCTAVCNGTGLEDDAWTNLSLGANDNVIATDLSSVKEMLMRIINCYNERYT